jgi:hypothetical protein
MKVLLAIAIVGLFFVLPAHAAAVHIYFNWQGEQQDTTRIVLLGLPDSPIECEFTKVQNPDNPDDQEYYQAAYDVGTIPDGSYVLTGKMKDMWGESEESAPFPFVKKLPDGVSDMELGL